MTTPTEAPRGYGFGTGPVFLASISTILGAVMFLRFGYAVGSVGLSPEALGLQAGATKENGGAGISLEQGLGAGTSLFKGQIERELVRQLGIFDEVEIVTGLDSHEDPAVAVRKWVTPELSILYRQGLSRAWRGPSVREE